MKSSPSLAPASPVAGADGLLAAEPQPQLRRVPCSTSPGTGIHVTSRLGKQRRDGPCSPLPAPTERPVQQESFLLGTHVNTARAAPAAFHLLNSVYISHSSLFSLRYKPIPPCVCVSVGAAFGRDTRCLPDMYLRPDTQLHC